MSVQRFSTGHRPLVIGHRGASGYATENSFEAFRLAAGGAGPGRCDGVELDVHVTADGAFVVHHDPLLSTGEAIAELPASRVRATKLPDGSAVPFLDEAVRVLRGLEVFVEVKALPEHADGALVALLRSDPAGGCQVHSFDHRVIARLHRLEPALPLGILSCSYPVDPIEPVRAAGAGTLWQGADLIDEALVARCHDAGLHVIAWTVNDTAEAARLTAIGVDGLCGNWPDRLRSG